MIQRANNFLNQDVDAQAQQLSDAQMQQLAYAQAQQENARQEIP